MTRRTAAAEYEYDEYMHVNHPAFAPRPAAEARIDRVLARVGSPLARLLAACRPLLTAPSRPLLTASARRPVTATVTDQWFATASGYHVVA